MADLMADYHRRRQLREFAQQKERLTLVESSLLSVASQGDFSKRASAASTALADLLDAEMCLLFVGKRKPNLVCVSGVSVLDPRSEVGLLARQILVRQLAANEGRLEEWCNATDRRSAIENSSEASGDLGQNGTRTPLEMQTSIDRLCELTHCRSIFTIALGAHSATYALLLFPKEHVSASNQHELDNELALEPAEICQAIGALVVGAASENASWKSWLPFAKPAVGNSNTLRTAQIWIARFALLAIAVVIALFPLPQQISATATLMPVEKIPYYAPIGGIVETIKVSDAQFVSKGQPLVQLRSDELSRQIDTLNGKLEFAKQKQQELEEVLSRGEGLSGPEKYQLEGDLEEIGIEQNSTKQQLEILEEQKKQLNIVAIEAGVVSSWDLRNRLLNRPVNAGDPLLTTFQPSGRWKLQLAIPDYRVGIVSRKLSEAQSGTPARSGIPVRFSLSSHPDQLQDAVLVSLSSQVNQQSSAASASTSRIVYGEAVLDAKQLPLTKDGAIARATIDCGKVPAAWLMVRDAYWAVSSRVQMIW